MRSYSKPGTNRLNTGAPITIPVAVLDQWDGPAVIATGDVWPRDALQGLALHKVDMRVTKRFKIVNDVKVELVWTPPWDPRTMASEEARLDLGIY